MSGEFRAVRVTDRVYWVGAIDWGLRNFHGYLTSRGTTYNAYLVLGDRPVLIDTVKHPFMKEMMSRVASVVDPAEIDCVISNHAEMDHSGCLPAVIGAVEPSRVIASKKGAQALAQHFHWEVEVEQVGTGDRVQIGDAAFRFVEARMLHWPDSMFAFLEGDGVLFTNDGFGMHLATSERFADEIDPSLLDREGAKYFANILLPFSPLVTKLVGQLPGLDLDVRIIAPDHGPIWREDPMRIVEQYARWAEQKPGRKAVVIYDTMWQSTAAMARAVGDGLAAAGVTTKLMPLDGSHRSDVATELLGAGALVVGSPTMNGQIYPTVADALTYLKGLKRKGLVGGAFGSYGWSGEAVGHVERHLEEMKVELAGEGVKHRYVPDGEALTRCRELGSAIADRLADSGKEE
jgi:flavorubredoxin